MNKIKTPLAKLIYDGACECFEGMSYLNKTLPDLSFGFEIKPWLKDKSVDDYRNLQRLYIEGYEYIKKYNIQEGQFDFGVIGGIINNKHALELSIIGNKIEAIIFSAMTRQEQLEYFWHEPMYYLLEDLQEAIRFAEARIILLDRGN